MVVAGEAKFSNEANFRRSLVSESRAVALELRGQSRGEKRVSGSVIVAGEAEFSNKMKFRVLWKTKAARKVLASCGELARGAEVSGNSSGRANQRFHLTWLQLARIKTCTRIGASRSATLLPRIRQAGEPQRWAACVTVGIQSGH